MRDAAQSERDRKRENGGNSALLCSVSDQLDMCDLCLLYVSVGNPTRQFQQTVLWGVAGRKWVGTARNKKEKMKDKVLLTTELR